MALPSPKLPRKIGPMRLAGPIWLPYGGSTLITMRLAPMMGLSQMISSISIVSSTAAGALALCATDTMDSARDVDHWLRLRAPLLPFVAPQSNLPRLLQWTALAPQAGPATSASQPCLPWRQCTPKGCQCSSMYQNSSGPCGHSASPVHSLLLPITMIPDTGWSCRCSLNASCAPPRGQERNTPTNAWPSRVTGYNGG